MRVISKVWPSVSPVICDLFGSLPELIKDIVHVKYAKAMYSVYRNSFSKVYPLMNTSFG